MNISKLQRLYIAALAMLLPAWVVAAPSLSIESFTIKAGETKEMLIDLTNPDTQVTLVQFDLRLPSGLSIATENGEMVFDIVGRTTWRKHSLDANASNGITRFLLASNSNAVLSGTSGAIISITLTAASSFNGGDIKLEEQLIVTPNAEETKPATYTYHIEGTTVVKDNIQFADATVKSICVQNWDTDSDGELSKDEAAAVTSLNRKFRNNTQITSFDEFQYFTGVTELNYDFYGCKNLNTVTLPANITSINTASFSSCENLKKIHIPKKVNYMGFNPFSVCLKLETITVASDNPYFDSRNGCNAIIKTDNNELISGCKTTVIPEGVVNINHGAFLYISTLTSINIPASVKCISYDEGWRGDNNTSAFCYCSGLTRITVASGNTVYDSRNNCNAVIETASNTLRVGCKATIIPNTVKIIGQMAFEGSGVTSVEIPNSIEEIKSSAFMDCVSLTEVTLSSSVNTIGQYAFGGCSNLQKVTSYILAPFELIAMTFNPKVPVLYVPKGKKAAYEAAGWSDFFTTIVEMEGADNIQFADAKVKAICVANWDTNGDGELSKDEAAAVTDLGLAFDYNTQITTFDEFQYFTGMTYADFSGCTKLRSLVLPESITFLPQAAFLGTALQKIHIPRKVAEIGDVVFSSCNSLTSITVDSNNPYFDSRNGCNGIIETAKNKLIAGCKTTVIPESVTSIGPSAIYYLSTATSIHIPASVTKLDEEPPFMYCTGLTSVTVAPGNPVYDSRDNCNAIIKTATNTLIAGCNTTKIPKTVKTIGPKAFQGSGITSIRIPSPVETLNYQAFMMCKSLTDVTLPHTLKAIKHHAFFECNNLKTVTSYIQTPFELEDSAFPSIANESQKPVLHVPAGKKAAYEAAGWDTYFKSIIEDVSTDIDEVNENENENESNVIYNLAGQRLTKLQRGVNIIGGHKVVVRR